MVFYNKKDIIDNKVIEKKIKCECDCGCGEEIRITKLSDEYSTDYFIAIATENFYSKQDGIIKTIKNRIKIAFNILRGKEYRMADLTISEADIKLLKKYLGEIVEE